MMNVHKQEMDMRNAEVRNQVLELQKQRWEAEKEEREVQIENKRINYMALVTVISGLKDHLA